MTAAPGRAASPAPQSGDHRWGGVLFDAFAREVTGGVEAWTAEDGGRIRYRDPVTEEWEFQTTPAEVKDTLRRVFFLPNTQTGWAVGQGGWVLKTTNGGTTWNAIGTRLPSQLSGSNDPHEELFDIHFIDQDKGWMVGLHSIWRTTNGGVDWVNLSDPLDLQACIPSFYDLDQQRVELYSIDVLDKPGGDKVGLIVGQPGIVLRSTDSTLQTWEVVWDVKYMCSPGDPCFTPIGNLSGCASAICPGGHAGPWFESWDVEISRNATEPLALFVGGVGSQCGMVFASTDDGLTWAPEIHECTYCPVGPPCVSPCGTDPDYNDDPTDPNDLNRHQRFKTLYGLAIFSDDNSAVAVGYNGQQMVRDPATSLWLDRSVFAAGVPTVDGTVTFPLAGAVALDLASSTKMAIITGYGGHLRESTNGGHTYLDKAIGEPHRIRDAFFKTTILGWHVGENGRIARTTTGGVSWQDQIPLPNAAFNGFLAAITFASTIDMEGVAVGDHFPIGGGDTLPKILYTDNDDQINNLWNDDVQVVGTASFMNQKGLKEVAWAGGTEFWAVGRGGLILKSTNGGQMWSMQQPENIATLGNFEFEGVAFLDPTLGILVGRRPIHGTNQGVAYQFKDLGGGQFTWTSLGLPSTLAIDGLTDVAISGTNAWVVGEQIVNGKKEGVVLKSILSGGVFGAFTDAAGTTVFPACVTGVALEDSPVLSEVEVAPNTGEVWIAGACGRIWSWSAAGGWIEERSGTDAHVVGMSFVPELSGARGFVAGFRDSETQQCITSVQ